MTLTKVVSFIFISFTLVEGTTRRVYPFEAEARLITDPIVNGAVALEDFIEGLVQPIVQPQFSGDKDAEPYDKPESLERLSRECRTEYVEECSIVDTEECVTVDKPTYTEECTTEVESVCSGGQGGGPGTYGVGATCQQVPKKVCHQIAHSNFETDCAKVPKKSCVTIPVDRCGQVPKQDCKLVPTATNCK